MATSLLLLLLLLLTTTTTTSTSSASAYSTTTTTTTTNTNSTDLIRLRCSTTLHPSLCFHSLSHFSSSSNNQSLTPIRLSQLATNLTLIRLRSLSSLVLSTLSSSSSSLTRRQSSALSDCRECLSDAVDLVSQSVEEIGLIEKSAGPDIGWHVSNALTWMSAALTNEDTCADSLQEAGMGSGSGQVVIRRGSPCWRIHRVMEFTSNALALVNSLVAS